MKKVLGRLVLRHLIARAKLTSCMFRVSIQFHLRIWGLENRVKFQPAGRLLRPVAGLNTCVRSSSINTVPSVATQCISMVRDALSSPASCLRILPVYLITALHVPGIHLLAVKARL